MTQSNGNGGRLKTSPPTRPTQGGRARPRRAPNAADSHGGGLAQLGAAVNNGSIVQAQFKLAEEIQSSRRVQMQQGLAAQINQTHAPAVPTLSVSGSDDATREVEARVMGTHALQRRAASDAGPEPASATASCPAVVQRRLTVKHVDYNPVTNQYRQGIIDQAAFLTDLRNEFNNDGRWANYRGQLANVLGAVRVSADAANAGQGWSKGDIPSLARTVAFHVIAEYNTRGLAAIGGQRAHLEEAVARLLADNIQHDPGAGAAMNVQEEGAYDALRGIVTDAHMSRVKGTASNLPYGSLPGPLKAGVDTVLGGIRAERAHWNGTAVRDLHIRYFLPGQNEEFNVAVRTSGRLTNYQGNHTNNAGWLPRVAAPASPVNREQASIYSQAHTNLKAVLDAPNAMTVLGLNNNHPTAEARMLFPLIRAARGNLTSAQLVTSMGAALAQGVSGYVEFNLPTDISRLVYDTVNQRIYVSAHYKWRAGFNPWFQVTGFPAV